MRSTKPVQNYYADNICVELLQSESKSIHRKVTLNGRVASKILHFPRTEIIFFVNITDDS